MLGIWRRIACEALGCIVRCMVNCERIKVNLSAMKGRMARLVVGSYTASESNI
jgi:hypothetical protein